MACCLLSLIDRMPSDRHDRHRHLRIAPKGTAQAEAPSKAERNRADYTARRVRTAGLTEREHEKKVLVPVRVPEGLMGRMMRLLHEGIANKTHPWKTPSEIIRALLVKGLESMKGQSEVVEDMMPYLDLRRQFEVIGQARREAQAALGRATHEIRELIGIGAKREALQYYHVTMEAARKMAPTAWRDWLIEQLRKNFPEFRKLEPEGVKLDTNKDEDGEGETPMPQPRPVPLMKLSKKQQAHADKRREQLRREAIEETARVDRELWEARVDQDRKELRGSKAIHKAKERR